MKRSFPTRALLIYFIGSFLLHFLWEITQAPLFAHHGNFFQSLRCCLFATATGDMIFTAIIYLSIAAAFAELAWIGNPDSFGHPAPWLLSIIVGVLLGLNFELWSIHVARRWIYESMPVIPVLGVGVTPLMQMIFIPIGALFICARVVRKRSRRV